MNRLKWLAGLPRVGGLTQHSKSTLIIALDRWEHSVEALVGMPDDKLTETIEFALMCSRKDAVVVAQATRELLTALIATAAAPPSQTELRKFVAERQLQLQARESMLGIYEALTSDDPTYNSFTIDPTTGKVFDPVWLQLALEMMYGLPHAT